MERLAVPRVKHRRLAPGRKGPARQDLRGRPGEEDNGRRDPGAPLVRAASEGTGEFLFFFSFFISIFFIMFLIAVDFFKNQQELAAALEKQAEAQRAVDEHIAHRVLDTKKVVARVAALRELLREATKPPPTDEEEEEEEEDEGEGGGKGGGGEQQQQQRQQRKLGALTQVDAAAHWTRRVDLREASMLADGFRCSCNKEQPVSENREK